MPCERVPEARNELLELRASADERSALILARRFRDRCRVERRILVEDRLVQVAERATRLDAELLDERAPRVLVRGQRLALSPRAVEREHQLRPQPFAERALHDQRL